MSSVYHILDKIPAIDPEDMEDEYEELAQQLVKSGKLRVDTDYQCNFVRFSDPNGQVNLMLSSQELTDPILLEDTKRLIASNYGNKLRQQTLEKKVQSIITNLQREVMKLHPVNPDTVLKLARLFVQSAHPIVIRWLLYDKVEVFITYSHNIGDMMGIKDWRHSGSNSGMQSTDGRKVAIFVSCGGDPFAPNNEKHPTAGDGWAAVSRLQIIAAQEIGHFSDIVRNPQGAQITRHSANFSGTMPTTIARISRLKDLQTCNLVLSSLMKAGMKELLSYEHKLKFYDAQKITGIKILWIKLIIRIYKFKIVRYALKQGWRFIKKFQKDKYMSLMIVMMIDDMKFNLNPIADVYSRSDKNAEEAIKCIEALARVPQQMMKWGHITTRIFMGELYKLYYAQVIPSLITNYNGLTKGNYKRNNLRIKKNFTWHIKKILGLQTKKTVLIPVREII